MRGDGGLVGVIGGDCGRVAVAVAVAVFVGVGLGGNGVTVAGRAVSVIGITVTVGVAVAVGGTHPASNIVSKTSKCNFIPHILRQ
jgi:hypothetical protein